MTKAFNLGLFANNVNSSGQIDASTGLYNTAPAAGELITTNFSIRQASGKLYFYHGSTAIASLDSSGNFVSLADVTAYGTP
ncbi:hypothetical protein UFOVP746_56 [uncultured Caudovirales phage]|jgi:hypothetical protein|uniref:Uncharacterized protein n=1 Tax=uncultured Caudovirales phage TaxID=2100421 RepID=A0A6J7X566_9CAUD|nr:hypothetical protein UFOVP746_56 [uncultured Caudovirales phage]